MAQPKVYPIYKGKRVSKLSGRSISHYKGTFRAPSGNARFSGS